MEERISDLANRNIEIILLEEDWELRFLKIEESLWELSDFIRKANIKIIGTPE